MGLYDGQTLWYDVVSMALDDKSYRQALSAYRKQRGLLTKAYRSYRQQGHRARRSTLGARAFEEAARVLGEGEARGVQVGGVQNYDQIRSNIEQSLAQQAANTQALSEFLSRPSQAASTINTTPQVSRLSVEKNEEQPPEALPLNFPQTGIVEDAEMQEGLSPEETMELNYYSPYLRNRSLLS